MQQLRTRLASFSRYAVGAIAGLTLFTAPAVVAHAAARMPAPKPVVSDVDLSRYAGKWFEIVSPKWSASGSCNDAIDVYTANPNAIRPKEATTLAAKHSCTRFGMVIIRADGNLYAPNPAETGRLVLEAKSSWGKPSLTHYDVIDLDPDYQWAVISDDFRQYIWILSRTPDLDVETLQGIKDRLTASGDTQAFSSTLRCVAQSTATTRNCQNVLGLK